MEPEPARLASPKKPLKESLRRQLIQKKLAGGLEHSNSPVLGFTFILLVRTNLCHSTRRVPISADIQDRPF
jgi:hypothetical protein